MPLLPHSSIPSVPPHWSGPPAWPKLAASEIEAVLRAALQKLPSLRSTQSVRIRPYSGPEGWTWALDKTAGAYRGRPEDTDRNAGIPGMLRSGMSWTAIQAATGAAGRPSPRSALGPRRAIADAVRGKGHKISHEGAAGVLRAAGVA
jgi:hypothetical protein